ncbi:hypothetical protein [Moraxella oculi]|uniref:Uncharacterized protein n=1 Tax=Moraxella oculi TaxID=2940516 RepID=A0ABW8U474_9GAMM
MKDEIIQPKTVNSKTPLSHKINPNPLMTPSPNNQQKQKKQVFKPVLATHDLTRTKSKLNKKKLIMQGIISFYTPKT